VPSSSTVPIPSTKSTRRLVSRPRPGNEKGAKTIGPAMVRPRPPFQCIQFPSVPSVVQVPAPSSTGNTGPGPALPRSSGAELRSTKSTGPPGRNARTGPSQGMGPISCTGLSRLMLANLPAALA
jgi:hypothetical protein